MPDTSIAITIKDNYSQAITTMINSTKAFSKDVDGMQAKLDTLNKTKTTLKIDTKAAKDSLTAAEKGFISARDKAEALQKRLDSFSGKKSSKAFWELRDQVTKANAAFADSGEALTEANAGFEQARRNLALVSKEAGTVEKAMVGLIDKNRKAGNQSGGGIGVGKSLMLGLASSGITQGIQDLAVNFTNAFAASAGGQEFGTIFSNALTTGISGATSGAMIGASMGTVGGPIGAVVGLATGAGVGILSGMAENQTRRDDSFKGYVQEQTEGQLSQRDTDIQTGSGIAARREQDAIAFNRLLGAGVGDTYLEDVRGMAASTPMTYDDLTTMSRSLATGFGSDPSRMLNLMEGIGNAGSAVGIDTSGMDEMSKAMSRMQSSGKASLEYLNIFQERGVNVIGMLASKLGKSQGEIYEMISKSELSGTAAVDIIEQGMERLYGGAMDLQSKTFAGRSSTLEDAQAKMQAAYGEGYNETRGTGIQEEIDWLTGESGKAQQELNQALGAFNASLENSKEQHIRNAVDEVMGGEAYQQAIAAGTNEGYAAAGRMVMEAKVRGMNEYNNTYGAQLALESELALATGIRNNTALKDSYWDAGHRMGVEFSKGLAAANLSTQEKALSEGGMLLGTAIYDKNGVPVGSSVQMSPEAQKSFDELRSWEAGLNLPVGTPDMYSGGWRSTAPKSAYGLNYVPRDDFPALLHEGERVLTASQARQTDRAGGNVAVTFTGPVTVREEADLDKLAQRFAQRLQRASLLAVPQ